MFKHLLKFTVLGILLAYSVAAVRAQSAVSAALSDIDLSEFPRVSALVDIRDPQGMFVSGLTLDQFTMIENGQDIAIGELVETRPGAQIVTAINLGNSFAIRDDNGLTRYDHISAILQNWLNRVGAENIDDLSLLLPGVTLVHKASDVNVMLTELQSFTPDLETAVPGLDTLSRALDVALESPSQPGMGRAVLFVTPLLPPESSQMIEDLGERAAQAGTRVFVFLVDSQSSFNSPEAGQLQSLSLRTGGQFFAFFGENEPPDFDFWFESARRKYRLGYGSRINTAGIQEIAVRVSAPSGSMLSETLNIDMALSPPNPVFVSVPGQVVRAIPDGAEILVENLEPKMFDLEVLFDFPDTIQREIVYSALYANGELILENNQAPFDTFTLDLTQFEASERVFIRVEARDELGLTGASLDIPLQITIQRPEQGIGAVLARNASVLTIATAALAGAILFLVLVLAGRITPRRIGDWRKKRKASGDPVTTPLSQVLKNTEDSPNRLAKFTRRLPAARLSLPRRRTGPRPTAFLVPLTSDGEPDAGNIISISSDTVTIGSDPGEAVIVLDNAAIEGLHARIWKNGDGGYYLADQDTVAGTWLNYAPVSSSGCRVEHGDLLHFAKVGFRFTLSKPSAQRSPVVIPDEEKV